MVGTTRGSLDAAPVVSGDRAAPDGSVAGAVCGGGAVLIGGCPGRGGRRTRASFTGSSFSVTGAAPLAAAGRVATAGSSAARAWRAPAKTSGTVTAATAARSV